MRIDETGQYEMPVRVEFFDRGTRDRGKAGRNACDRVPGNRDVECIRLMPVSERQYCPAGADDQRRPGWNGLKGHGSDRKLLQRDALFARREKAVVVNLSQLRDARQAECCADLSDILGKTLPIIGTDAVLECRGRNDLMTAEPSQSFGLYIEVGKSVVFAERYHCRLRVGDGIAPAARSSSHEGSDSVRPRLQEGGVGEERVAVYVEAVVGVIDDRSVFDGDAVRFQVEQHG